ncbi:MAG: C40 family peptidase [Actinobacteria bacterium]|nr:C40 family peptidase [Actinomycetota bacterium]
MATRIARVLPTTARVLISPRAGVAVGVLAAAAAVTLGLPATAGAAPSTPSTDTVASVTAKLTQLSQQNEVLSEKLNAAVANVSQQQAALSAAQEQASAAEQQYERSREQLTSALTQQYEGGDNFSHAGALLTSPSGQAFVDKLSTLNMLTAHRNDILRQVNAAKAAANAATKKANDLLTQANAQRDDINKQKSTLEADTKTYQNELAQLNAQQRNAYVHRDDPTPNDVSAAIAVHAGSAGAQAAIDYALKQVGKSYRFATSGPNSFDCSGLTAAAYAQAGISLPHNAAAQFGYGQHVDVSQLQPGDLIFLYHPISHVEIYIGNGLAVSAADEAEGVVVVNIFRDMKSYTGATRLV